jgi:hypothetical protein
MKVREKKSKQNPSIASAGGYNDHPLELFYNSIGVQVDQLIEMNFVMLYLMVSNYGFLIGMFAKPTKKVLKIALDLFNLELCAKNLIYN